MVSKIRSITWEDKSWIVQILTEHWGSNLIISRGQSHDASELPGFVAMYDNQAVGLATYRISGHECELVTLDSWQENKGVGTALIERVKRTALEAGCSR
jgi:N-acetylglutamate synthase-like GNAT family acetyltransferase